MNNAAIFQYFEGDLHREMHAVTNPRHVAYAKRHRFDLYVIEEHGPIDAAYGWVRWSRMLELFRAGYEYVVHVEADCVIDDHTVDLRDAVRSKPLGLIFGGDPDHYQTGVIFARNDKRVIDFCKAVMAACPPPGVPEETDTRWWERKHCQQGTATDLLLTPKYAGIVERLPLKWNNALWNPLHGITGMNVRECIIRAWHGVPGEQKKLDSMRRFETSRNAARRQAVPRDDETLYRDGHMFVKLTGHEQRMCIGCGAPFNQHDHRKCENPAEPPDDFEF